MPNSFRFVALAAERFRPLFGHNDADLAAAGACRMVADSDSGFPCRVSLEDARAGETVLLLPFSHHDVVSPYRASGPIFVREDARTAMPAVGEVPDMIRRRLLSIRGYDVGGMMRAGEVCEGRDVETVIEAMFAGGDVAYLHVHNARPGCYNCRVERA